MALRGEYWWVRWRPDGLEWARCLSQEAVPREEGRCTGWDELPAPASARLVLCVPGERVRIHTVRIPTRNRRRFRAALPFALEDQLLHGPEAYHFAPLPRSKGQTETAVAVVEQGRMADWLADLSEHDWHPRLLVPEFLAMAPPETGVWRLDASESPMLLRFPRGEGGAALAGAPGEQPPGGLLLALEEAANPPETLRVRVADSKQHQAVSRWQSALEPQGVSLEIREDERSRAAWLAREPLPERGCNLLTGPFATGEDPWQWARRLAPAAAMAGLLLVILAAQWFLEGARIRAEHQRLEQAIEATYREAFPEARNLVDPRYQMEQRLERLRRVREEGDEGRSGLLGRLQGVAPLLMGEGDTRVQSLRLEGQSLTLEVSLPDYEALERLQKRLSRKRTVEVKGAELKEGRVHGRIRIPGEA